MDKLKPCPFCGGGPELTTGNNPFAFCMSCYASTGRGYSTKEEAIAAWNRRPPAHCYTVEELRPGEDD